MINWCKKLILVLGIVTPSSGGEHIQYTLNETSGIIKSPNYATLPTYPDNLNITWTIRAKRGFLIGIYFSVFDLEDSYDEDLGGPCVYDFIKINDAVKRKFCGSSTRYSIDAPRIMHEFLSSTDVLSIDFVTDYSNDDPLPKGFVAHYRHKDRDECWELKTKAFSTLEDWDELLYCNQHCHNTPGSYYCSCDVGFKLHENGHTCMRECWNKTLTSLSGEIYTYHHPSSYSKLADCDWTIEQKVGISIEIRFVDEFSIEKHPDEGCVYDYVQYEVATGNKSEPYCGTDKPNKGDWILTNSHIVKVFFHSDLTIEEAGFKMEYRARKIKCPSTPKAPANGYITSTIKEYEFEDIVTFRCEKGYKLIGKDKIACQSDTTWDGEEPTCQIKECKSPKHIENAKHGRIKEDNFTLHYGSEITFLCYTWYEMTSGTSMWRCEDDETWHEASPPVANNDNRNIPKCEPICGLKGNVKIRKGTFDFGDTIPNVEDPQTLLDTQIWKGKKSKEAEWPWIVFLDLMGRSGLQAPTKICSGSLLSPTIVVTAAHCTRLSLNKDSIRVYVGVTDRRVKQNVQVFSVSRLVEHPQYGSTSDFENDIAVLTLNSSVKIGKYARPICLPRSKREKNLPAKALSGDEGYQNKGVIAGWGKTAGWAHSIHLLQVRIPPIPHKTCVEHFESEGFGRLEVSKNMLCAGFIKGGRDSCEGDSGGPYMFKDTARSRWILSGIVSHGSSSRRCGDATFGIYTNVAKYVEWLEPFLVED